MAEFRFIHASDLHLGRRFANIPEPPDGQVRGRLREARHGAIERLASAARDRGAGHVLLAGDTFDTPTPSDQVWRQALAAMAEDPGLTWWLLPGNHDNLQEAEPLWERLAAEAPDHVRVLTRAAPRELAPGAVLLPVPVTFRSAGRDLTEALPGMASAEGAMRLGLAHGGVTDFTESGANIPPDRDRSAGLDFLALGDWHGRLEIGPRVQYPGTPEQDRFKHGRKGLCLAVTLPGPGAAPEIEEVEIGQFHWAEAELALTPGRDAAAALAELLPEGGRRDRLLRLRAHGWTSLADRAALLRAAGQAAPDFAHFETDLSALRCETAPGDLDAIDRGGALRLAAEALAAEGEDAALDQDSREIAAAALARLHGYVTEDAS